MTGPLIALDGVSVTRDGAAVLEGAVLQLGAGERLAIVGANGAGKTTLLRTIMGLQAASAGEVRLFGQPCATEAAFRRQRRRIGFLFQDSDDQLFCPTVLEDVAFGPLNLGLSQAEAFNRAREVLESLQIAPLANRVIHRLSGGEKRLVCLAGVLAMRPDVLLLDEPTNGVDAAHAQRLLAELAGFPGAMVLVSHDAGFVAGVATRALMLDGGRLVPALLHDHPHSHPHLHPARAG